MKSIRASEGWFVSHLFFYIDRIIWESLDDDTREDYKHRFEALFRQTREQSELQIYCYSIWGLKADLGLLIVDPDLQHLNQLETDFAQALGPGTLQPAYSFISLSESSEYVSQEKDYDKVLRNKEGLDPGSKEYRTKMDQFRARMKEYIDERLYPELPDHEVMCFYPMNKIRGEQNNWYLLDFDTRKKFMASHGITGRRYAEHIKQLVTGSVGLDDWEWGVTLFAQDPYYFKKIVYEMRYDEASARFAEFGEFLVGVNLEPQALLERLRL